MLLKIENQTELIDTLQLKQIGEGKDGKIYKLGNSALKLTESGYMTEEKAKDLIKAVPPNRNNRLIIPKNIVYNPKSIKISGSYSMAGYTSELVNINNEISTMTSEEYLNEMMALWVQIEKYFSHNKIAITDINAQNLLSSIVDGEKRIFLIDHDRNITPSCNALEKEIIKDDYSKFNEKKFALLMYSGILYQVFKLAKIKKANSKDLNNYIEEELNRKNTTLSNTEKVLSDFDTIQEYAEVTLKKIKKRK